MLLFQDLPDDETVRRELKGWVRVREQTIQKLGKLAEYLDNLSSNCNVAKLAGGGVAIASGLIGLATLIAVPFTGGLSLFGTAACAAAGVGGGGTLLITDIIKKVNEDSSVQEANDAVKNDRKKTGEFYQAICLEKTLDMIKAGKMVGGVTKGVAFVGRISTSLGSRILARGGQNAVLALRTVGQAAKLAKFAGPILSVVFLPIDIADVVSTAIEMSDGSLNAAAVDIRKIINELQDELNTFKSDPDFNSLVR